MNKIEILKASAGSGKTYNLALSYIRLLLAADDRYAYRHILAVTFTNKATEEMKSRILKELYVLSRTPEKSPYLEELMKMEKFQNMEDVSKAASVVLCNILHDYSSFAVSTIDGFFQRALKAFSRELGQFASYKVELDKQSLVNESVDRILDSLSENDKQMLNWLTDKAIQQLEAGKGYNFENELKSLAQSLKSEHHRVAAQKCGMDISRSYTQDSITALKSGCKRAIAIFEQKVHDAATDIERSFLESGVKLGDTDRGFMKKLYDYIEWTDSTRDGFKSGKKFIPIPTDIFIAKASDTEKWFPVSRKKLLPLVISHKDKVDAFLALFDRAHKVYNTANILLNQIFGFTVAADLYKEFDSILKEKNVLSIDDSNTILKNIIDGTDTPFVYEKLGVRYEHFLLDEFQDTSNVQWDNFRPLLKNSIDSGFYNLIVGDVKQSIYRWRDSDWKLFDSEVESTFHRDSIHHRTLKENYRSCKNIVEFNNGFFKTVSSEMDIMLNSYGIQPVVSRIYKDVEQQVACSIKSDGYVRFTFIPEETSQEEQVWKAVERARQAGFSYKDIAVLARKNEYCSSISKYLIDKGVPVVTTEALRISSAVTVQRIVSLLGSMNNPEDKISSFFTRSLDIVPPKSYHSLVDLCEEFIRALKIKYPEAFKADIVYVQSFMDLLRDFVEKEGNSLDAFLSFWKEDKSYIPSAPLQDSVAVMTIHKSKGLDFPYVIVPYLQKPVLYKANKKWSHPDIDGTDLDGVATGVYNVTLSGQSDYTLFASEYRNELMMQYVDKINMYYVAATRASQGLHLISEFPEENVVDAVASGIRPDFNNFADLLYWYIQSKGEGLGIVKEENSNPDDESLSWYIGENLSVAGKKKEGGVRHMECRYESYPLNPTLEFLDSEGNLIDVREAGRLKFTTDSVDFFNEDGAVGIDASRRLRGVVLHDVLARVLVPADLRPAVEEMVMNGSLPQEEADEVEAHLAAAIESVKERGWFPDDAVPGLADADTAADAAAAPHILREAEIIDPDGSVHRPDRVVLTPEKAIVIDYKFGLHHQKYQRQIAQYASLFRQMGYAEVETALWYVDSGEIIGDKS